MQKGHLIDSRLEKLSYPCHICHTHNSGVHNSGTADSGGSPLQPLQLSRVQSLRLCGKQLCCNCAKLRSNIDLSESTIMLCTPEREQTSYARALTYLPHRPASSFMFWICMLCRWDVVGYFCIPWFIHRLTASAQVLSFPLAKPQYSLSFWDEPLCKHAQQMNSRFKQQMELGFYLVDLDMILALLHQLSAQIPSEFWNKPETPPVHTSNINFSYKFQCLHNDNE